MNKKKTLKIVKIGGNVIDNPKALYSFLKTLSSIQGPKILVHGGGKSATALAEQTGMEVKMIVGVNMIKGEVSFNKSFKLCGDFSF